MSAVALTGGSFRNATDPGSWDQSGSQLDAICGPLQGRAIRDVVPGPLIMYGAHELRAASFWAGKTTRSHRSYNHNSDDKTTYRCSATRSSPRN